VIRWTKYNHYEPQVKKKWQFLEAPIRCSTIGPSASAGKKDSASSSLGLGPSPFGSLP
jgi:hypothetical protein